MNVTYVLTGDVGEQFGLKPGYAVLGLSCMSADEVLNIVSGRRALADEILDAAVDAPSEYLWYT